MIHLVCIAGFQTHNLNESPTITTSIGLPLEKKLKPLSLLRQMLHQYHGGRDWSISQTNLDCFDEFCVNLSAHQLGQCCFLSRFT